LEIFRLGLKTQMGGAVLSCKATPLTCQDERKREFLVPMNSEERAISPYFPKVCNAIRIFGKILKLRVGGTRRGSPTQTAGSETRAERELNRSERS
jgi:hypothetical protein